MINIGKYTLYTIIFIAVLGVLFALPNVLSPEARQYVEENLPSWIPNQTVNLGLDLRGGSHLLLEVEMAEVIRDRIDSLTASARSISRTERIRPDSIRRSEAGIIVTLREDDARDTMLSALRKFHRAEGVAVRESGDRIEVFYDDDALRELKQKTIQQSIEIIRRRIDETGTKEPIIQSQGEDRILVQLPGVDDPERIKSLLGKTARMTFHLVDMDVSCSDTRGVPAGTKCLPHTDGTSAAVPIKRRALLSGDMLDNAASTFDQQSGQPVVSFRFNGLGARKFGDITKNNVGKLFAIVLDDTVITAPRINEPILGGSGQISGNFTPEKANDMSILLRAGALPAPLTVVEERSVGPSLGADSIEAGKLASVVGLGGIIFFMFLSYGRFGWYADIALLINMALIIGLLSMLQATLTLPGIAGIVLTIGMAVDANVLVFERIREEIAAGRSPVSAIDKGYQGAMSTIIDANVTTFIAALLLFILGTGPVKGFAVTLMIGIITSMYSAIYLTRVFVVYWLRRNRPDTLKI